MSIEDITTAAVTAAAAQLFERARDQVPSDVLVEAVEGGIRLTGRRLLERAATDARLREIGR